MTASIADWREATAAEMSERELLAIITHMARELGYAVYHPHRSEHSERGWPDLALARVNATYGPPRFLVAELKREDGTLTPAQYTWRDALLAAGIEWHLWRPRDLLNGDVFEILRLEDLHAISAMLR